MSKAKKIALITGITGQDGSYLTELLLEKGYTVHGIVRRTSNLLRSRIEHLRRDQKIYGRRLFLHYGDLSDSATLSRIVADVQPIELYHLAGQSHVGLTVEIPESTCEESGMATLRLLEIARAQRQPLRFYHASSSEIFGNASEIPQSESTPLFFFFQAEDGIRDVAVTGVQTCALPIWVGRAALVDDRQEKGQASLPIPGPGA